MPIKLAFAFLISLPVLAQYSPPAGVGGTCAGLGGDVTGTCAANSIKSSVGLTGAPTTPTGTVGDASTQISNDAFVAGVVASINPAVSVQAATIAVLSNTPTYSNGTAGVGATLTAASNGALTIDGYTVLLNDRVLVKNQASTFQNGIYTETTLGTAGVPYVLTRATDYNATTNINYTGTIPVLQGSTLLNTGWNGPTNIVTVGTDAITYTQAAAGNAGGPPGGNVKATGNLASGDVITGAGGKTLQDSGTTFTAIRYRTCVISNDTQSATALTAAQMSGNGCVIPLASTIVEVDVTGGTGTVTGTPTAPNYTGTGSVQIGKTGSSSSTGLLSGALATVSGKACAQTAISQSCILNGVTSSGSVTVSTPALAKGDELYVTAATPDAAQTWYAVTIIYTVN